MIFMTGFSCSYLGYDQWVDHKFFAYDDYCILERGKVDI